MVGALVRASLVVEVYLARLMYQSLYPIHGWLRGAPKVALKALARMITPRTEPRVNLLGCPLKDGFSAFSLITYHCSGSSSAGQLLATKGSGAS